MMQITISLDPVIWHVGGLAVRWYSLAIMVAIIVAVWFTTREFRRKRLDDTNFGNVALITIVSGVLGARLFHILDRAGYYLDNPASILDFMSGGLAIYGAVIGGFLGVVIGTRLYNLPLLKTIDAVAPGLVLAQAIGRFGCIVNGDAWGAKTDSPFAFVYTNPDAFIPNRLLNQPTHPYPVYDMLMNLAIFGVLIWLRNNRRLPDGALFAIFVAVYGFGRFFISFVREERVWFWGLQEAQVIAIASVVLGVTALVLLLRRGISGERAMQLEAAH